MLWVKAPVRCSWRSMSMRCAAVRPSMPKFWATAPSCDAYHITAPAPAGSGGAACMLGAVSDGGTRPEDVDYINAHGTSTPMNDRCETLAIHKAFGSYADKLMVSSTKSMTGHLLGAAGAVEAIFTALALRDGFVPATLGYRTPG